MPFNSDRAKAKEGEGNRDGMEAWNTDARGRNLKLIIIFAALLL